jgi:apolipoprotein N-acyltransferase
MTLRDLVLDPVTRTKRADFIANLSNDGWFAGQEKHQHLQSTVFRCIETRLPMARSSNTGISCFIDSSGRVLERIGPGISGFAVRQLELDDRLTFYTRYGELFAGTCLGLIVAACIFRLVYRGFFGSNGR